MKYSIIKQISIKKEVQKKDKKMCKKIDELHELKPDELLKRTEQEDKIPVDVAQICYDFGIRLSPFDFSPIEKNDDVKNEVAKRGNILGAAVVSGDNLAILYRQADSSNRRRFTIAHELAHCCLHMSTDADFHVEFRTDSSNEKNQKEYEANLFAGKLLIPEKSLKRLIGDAKYITKQTSIVLAKLFLVSQNVLNERLRTLKINVL